MNLTKLTDRLWLNAVTDSGTPTSLQAIWVSNSDDPPCEFKVDDRSILQIFAEAGTLTKEISKRLVTMMDDIASKRVKKRPLTRSKATPERMSIYRKCLEECQSLHYDCMKAATDYTFPKRLFRTKQGSNGRLHTVLPGKHFNMRH